MRSSVSCPNVENRGLVFACDPDAAAAVVGAVRRHTAPSVPVLAKLSPDVTDIVSIARACSTRACRRAYCGRAGAHA